MKSPMYTPKLAPPRYGLEREASWDPGFVMKRPQAQEEHYGAKKKIVNERRYNDPYAYYGHPEVYNYSARPEPKPIRTAPKKKVIRRSKPRARPGEEVEPVIHRKN